MKTLIAIAMAMLCATLGMTSLVLLDLHRAIPATTAKINLDLDEVHRATLEIGLTAENLRKASLAWQQASQSQVAATTSAQEKLNSNLDALQHLITNTNYEINEQLLPGLQSSIAQQSGSLADLEKQTAASLDDLQRSTAQLAPILANAAIATDNAAKLTGDPALAQLLHHLDDASASTAATAANVDATTGDIRAFVHRETAPVKGTWNVIKAFLMEFAGPVAEVFTAAKH